MSQSPMSQICMAGIQRTNRCCVESANYPHFQKAGESTSASAFGIRTIHNGEIPVASPLPITRLLRTAVVYRTETGTESDCVQPTHSRRVSLLEMRGIRVQSLRKTLARSVALACCAYTRSGPQASRYQDRSGFSFSVQKKHGRADCRDT